jgi:hypothetical protein
MTTRTDFITQNPGGEADSYLTRFKAALLAWYATLLENKSNICETTTEYIVFYLFGITPNVLITCCS